MARKKTAETGTETDGIPPGFELLHTLRGHTQSIWNIAWSPDGHTIASSSSDGTVRLWDTQSGKPFRVLKVPGDQVYSVNWSPDGHTLAYGSSDGTIHLWNAKNSKPHGIFTGHHASIYSLAWSPDGRRLASGSGDQTLRIWDAQSNESLQILKQHNDTSWGIAWSPDGRRLASSSYDRQIIYLWDTQNGECLHTFEGHNDAVISIAWTQGGQVLASGSSDRTIRLWDAETGRQVRVLEGHAAYVYGVVFSPDDQLLASQSTDNTVRLWRCDIWEQVGLLNAPTAGTSGGLAFHPSLPLLATRGEKDRVIRIWRLDYDILLGAAPAAPAVHYTNAKVVLVGETSTGKTCLARALMGETFEPQESTHGIQVWHFHTETAEQPGAQVTRETLLWDLAGQTDYQVVHQLFLDETALGIVLFDPTHPEDPFGGVGHWEKALRRVAGDDCPRLLVAGRVDRGHPTATAADIEAFRREHGFGAFVATSAKTGAGVEELRAAIARAIRWDRLPITRSPELWKDIREYLLERRAGEDVITRRADLRAAYGQRHPQAEFGEAEFDTVIGHAQAQGLVWRLSFGDFVLLKPELLNSYAAAMVRAARKHPEGLGCVIERDVLDARIDFEDLERIADAQTERSLLYAVVELFLAREVALREGEHLVFPSKFNRKRPDYPRPPLREVAYSFAGSVEDIYATLSVRLSYCGAFELANLYKNAAEFHDQSGRTCGFLLSDTTEGYGGLSVFFDEMVSIDSRALFLRFIHEHLHKRALPNTLKRERMYRCQSCRQEIKDREAVEIRLRLGRSTIVCQYCDQPIALIDLLEQKFGNPELLRRVRELEAEAEERKGQVVGVTTARAKDDIGEFDVFLAHNSQDKPQVEAIGEALRQRGLNPWLDKWNLPPGRRFAEEIERALPAIKSVAIFVGANGIGPWEDLEIYAALDLFVKNKRPLIPVLLPGTTQEPKLPLFLRQFGWVRFGGGVDDSEALDSLEWGITGERPRRAPQ